jgi:prophage DNA circulation protein
MSWRDNLRPASFRGVPFHVKAASGEAGRRVVVHEYPKRDTVYPEDMGRAKREFMVEGFVIGADYMDKRDKLLAAIEEPGSGPLVHPYRGTITVTATQPARWSENIDEGGLCRISMTFVEGSANEEPTVRADTQGRVASAADDALGAVAEDFGSVFSVDGLPAWAAQHGMDMASSLLGQVDTLTGLMRCDGGLLSEFGLARLGGLGNMISLVQNPGALADLLLGSISALASMALSPLDGFRALSHLFDFGDEAAPSPLVARPPLFSTPAVTPTRQAQARNQAAIIALARQGALVEAARLTSRMTWPSYDEAVATRDTVAGRLDDQLTGVAMPTIPGASSPVRLADPAHLALAKLRVAVVKDVSERGSRLARVGSVELPSTLPAVVAAHRIYGDATRADEIVARNRVVHPGFVPGGRALEVLL